VSILPETTPFPEYEDRVEHLCIRSNDDPRCVIGNVFDRVADWIRDALTTPRPKVLVHCGMGVSRSATLVIAYLIRERRVSFKKALDLVIAKRSCVWPNFGFQIRLLRYEDCCRGGLAFPHEEGKSGSWGSTKVTVTRDTRAATTPPSASANTKR